MVGIAGKSQACNTCRTRRVKCDLGRPFCLKCLSSNRQCTGYERGIIFVNRTPSNPSSTALSVLSRARTRRSLQTATSNKPTTESTLRQLYFESLHDVRPFRTHAVELLKAIYLPKEPSSYSQDAEIVEGSFSWVHNLADLSAPSRSLNTSLHAFCLIQLHVTGTGQVSLYECLNQYNMAVRHLCLDLDDAEKRIQEETLAAILVLTTCELFVCPKEHGWSAHVQGITEILRLRDPRTAKTSTWRHLCSRMRLVCTIRALTKRDAHFLESDVWRHIMSGSDFDDALDQIFLLLVDLPAILQTASTLPGINDQDLLMKESSAVMHSLIAKLSSIKLREYDICKASGTSRFWLITSTATNPVDANSSDKVFPLSYEFESFAVAVLLTMCWAVAADLCSNLIQIHNLAQIRSGHKIELEDLLKGADADLNEVIQLWGDLDRYYPLSSLNEGRIITRIEREGTRMARYICQSLEYIHHIKMGTYGCHASTYQTWCARQYFRLHPGHEREWLWLQNKHSMTGPDTSWGLSKMSFDDVREPLGGLSIPQDS